MTRWPVWFTLLAACGGDGPGGSPDAPVPVDGRAIDAPVDAAIDAAPDAPQPIEHPRDCVEARQGNPGIQDGEYVLYAGGSSTMPWTAYCHGMSTPTPVAFLAVGPTTKGTIRRGTSVATTLYTHLRIDAVTLVIDLTDATFADTSNPGGIQLPGAGVAVPAGWAEYENAPWDSPRAVGIFDIRDTGLRFEHAQVSSCTIAEGSSGGSSAGHSNENYGGVVATSSNDQSHVWAFMLCYAMGQYRDGAASTIELQLYYDGP